MEYRFASACIHCSRHRHGDRDWAVIRDAYQKNSYAGQYKNYPDFKHCLPVCRIGKRDRAMGAVFGTSCRHCIRCGGLCQTCNMRGKTFAEVFQTLGICRNSVICVVGAEVNIQYALQNCGPIICVILLALIFRMGGVLLCVAKSKLNMKEKLFCMVAYTPKATVQAAIGSIPLTMGLTCGQTVLTAAVLGILITAPLGALLTDITCKKLLTKTAIEKI